MKKIKVCGNWSFCKTFIREHSSKDWLLRQKTDPYIEKAKINNYRCRSAFKLLQMDDRFSILKPGQCVIDIGAAPGSWSQVVASKVNSNCANSELPSGFLIGIDLQQMYPIKGVTLLGNSDFTSVKTWQKIKELLNYRPIDVVLSDMAPNATGVKHLDHDLIINLAYSVVKFAVLNSTVGATCLIKILNGNQNSEVEKTLLKFYSNVKFVKPDASRSDSSEIYLLARGFKGLKQNR